jgi:3-methyladenine DNA glycosylase AlkD
MLRSEESTDVKSAGERLGSLRREIRDWCAAHADPKNAARYQRYFREGWDAWGIRDDEAWRARKRQWLDDYADLTLADHLKLGETLFATGKYEEGATAIYFVKRHEAAWKKSTLAGVAKWFAAGVGNWAHTDVICAELLAPMLRTRVVRLEDFARWRRSRHKYQRRAVPVAMLGLLKTEAPDYTAMLDFLRPMMHDEERVVHQGLGWFLREAWKKQPRPVEAFLLDFKDTAPRLVFQYATEKMTPEQKKRFRRGGS